MNTLAPGATGRKIIGIDIGLQGAVAVLDMEGILLAVREHGPIHHVFVEFVSARPGEGAVGAFAFGRGRGIVEGVCGALSIPVSFITPASWKRAVNLPPGTDKDRSRSIAVAGLMRSRRLK